MALPQNVKQESWKGLGIPQTKKQKCALPTLKEIKPKPENLKTKPALKHETVKIENLASHRDAFIETSVSENTKKLRKYFAKKL